jgi:hypothetical protein
MATTRKKAAKGRPAVKVSTARKKKAPAKRESGKDPHPRYLADKRRYKYNGQPRLVYRLVTSEPVEFELDRDTVIVTEEVLDAVEALGLPREVVIATDMDSVGTEAALLALHEAGIDSVHRVKITVPKPLWEERE